MPDEHELGDQPIEQEYIDKMNEVARALDEVFNGENVGVINERKVGFVLMVFEYGETRGRCNYISNGANRADIVELMKEQIRHFQGN